MRRIGKMLGIADLARILRDYEVLGAAEIRAAEKAAILQEREAMVEFADLLRTTKYIVPTEWDYGAQDACVAFVQAIRARKDSQ